MEQSRRDQFVARVSTVGWGTRESIQALLGAVVAEVREGVISGRYDDGEMDAVVDFHDQAEYLWRQTIATNPPIPIPDLCEHLEDLIEASKTEPVLAMFEQRLDRGLRDARALEAAKQNPNP